MTAPAETDFDDWLIETFAEAGSFTMLFVLVRITERTVEPLRSAWLHVVGDETRWPDMVALFAGAGVDWSGAVFYRAGREGLVVGCAGHRSTPPRAPSAAAGQTAP